MKYIAFAVVTICLPFIALIGLKIFQYFSAGKVKSLACLVGKTAIVTGGRSGNFRQYILYVLVYGVFRKV